MNGRRYRYRAEACISRQRTTKVQVGAEDCFRPILTEQSYNILQLGMCILDDTVWYLAHASLACVASSQPSMHPANSQLQHLTMT